MALITKISWIDIAGILIFTRVIYAALRRGLLNEFIKLLAVFSAGFLALQYYPLLLGGIFTRGPFFFRQSQLNIVSFFIIFIFVSFIFSWLRKGLALLMPRDTYPRWEVASAFLLGVARASLLLSLLVFVVYLFPGHLSQNSRSLSFVYLKILHRLPISKHAFFIIRSTRQRC